MTGRTGVKGRKSKRHVVVVGSGIQFLSGISIYTIRLSNALTASNDVVLITMRRLLPARLYPGRRRVNADLTTIQRDPSVTFFDGVDWFWLPSMLGGAWSLVRHRPHVVIFQWWTGTVLHSYIFLALSARMVGARVDYEFHEIIETGELRVPLAATYVRTIAPLLMRGADGFVVHSDFDKQAVKETWARGRHRPIAVVPLGPLDHYVANADIGPIREAPAGTCNLLFFGIIRPYKGLEHLIQAYESLTDEEAASYWLTVVGETWEGWTLPTTLIENSRRRNRITFINRYVTDSEAHGYLQGADAVILPYIRSSISGPLHVVPYGVPIVTTGVGGNVEATATYEGIVLVPPADPEALTAALGTVRLMADQRYEHSSSGTLALNNSAALATA